MLLPLLFLWALLILEGQWVEPHIHKVSPLLVQLAHDVWQLGWWWQGSQDEWFVPITFGARSQLKTQWQSLVMVMVIVMLSKCSLLIVASPISSVRGAEGWTNLSLVEQMALPLSNILFWPSWNMICLKKKCGYFFTRRWAQRKSYMESYRSLFFKIFSIIIIKNTQSDFKILINKIKTLNISAAI